MKLHSRGWRDITALHIKYMSDTALRRLQIAYENRDGFWKDLRQKGLIKRVPEKRLISNWDLGQIAQGYY